MALANLYTLSDLCGYPEFNVEGSVKSNILELLRYDITMAAGADLNATANLATRVFMEALREDEDWGDKLLMVRLVKNQVYAYGFDSEVAEEFPFNRAECEPNTRVLLMGQTPTGAYMFAVCTMRDAILADPRIPKLDD